MLCSGDCRCAPRGDRLPLARSGFVALRPPLGRARPTAASRWIAPEWRGANQEGLFREHPAGILLPSVVLIRAGFLRPGRLRRQHAVSGGGGCAIPLVAGVVVKGFEARSLAWILQLFPLTFVPHSRKPRSIRC